MSRSVGEDTIRDVSPYKMPYWTLECPRSPQGLHDGAVIEKKVS